MRTRAPRQPETTESGNLDLFAVAAPGLEPIVASELEALGITGRLQPGGVSFRGEMHAIRTANLELRVASRVLLRVARFEARSFHELERFARRIDWSTYLAPGVRAELNVTCRRSKLYHERAVEERVLAAIERSGAAGTAADRDLDTNPTRSSASGDARRAPGSSPSQLFVVRFDRDSCTISADTSGELLHVRGYRQALAKAPLRETLAAAMLLASGWSADRPLLDPMCGSGTIAIESALIARRVAPGLLRLDSSGFAFERWPGHDGSAWRRAIDRATDRVLAAAPAAIHASDRDQGAIRAAVANANRAGVSNDIEFTKRALSAAESPGPLPWLICNPPYGQRVGKSDRLRDLYAALGNLVRRAVPDASVALLSADPRLDGQVGLDFDEVFHTRNGGVPVRFIVSRPA